MNYIILEKAKPYVRTRKGKLERVKGYAGFGYRSTGRRLTDLGKVGLESFIDSKGRVGLSPVKRKINRKVESSELHYSRKS
jgi:hypothetical protein